MFKNACICLFLFGFAGVFAQTVRVPVDLRQHNLTEYNANLFNPVFSYQRNKPSSLAFWTRYQWQYIDTDPTTLYLNYTHLINEVSAASLGFFQHNTGIFLNTGGVVNYAYNFNLNPDLTIGLGLNLFGFNQVLADNRFNPEFPINLPQSRDVNDFIMQAAPGVYAKWRSLGIGVASENLFYYNFTTKERYSDTDERIYMISSSYDFYMFSNTTMLRPTVYWKTIPFLDDQLGINALFSADEYWLQAGYNDFYGISLGAGANFLKSFSFGAQIEFATDDFLKEKEPSFEIIAAYRFARQQKTEENQLNKIASTKNSPSRAAIKKSQRLVAKRENDIVKQSRLDAIQADRKLAAYEKSQQDSLMQNSSIDDIRYETANKVDGQEQGYYIIANVFRTKKNAAAFMAKLSDMDLEPKSFFRSAKNFTYVYLRYFDTVSNAKQAIKNRMNGKYTGDLWIFRVLNDN